MNVLFILLLVLLSGCELFDSGKKETEAKVEQYFRAELNGEPWSGIAYNAILMNLTGLRWMNLFALYEDAANFPYSTDIGFAIHYSPQKTNYNVLRRKEENDRTSGGSFIELDGDAIIARYEPIPDSLNSLTIQIGKDEEGRRFVTGTFAMTVVVDPGYDDEHNNRYRQHPDTVRITNGEFRVLLEERE